MRWFSVYAYLPFYVIKLLVIFCRILSTILRLSSVDLVIRTRYIIDSVKRPYHFQLRPDQLASLHTCLYSCLQIAFLPLHTTYTFIVGNEPRLHKIKWGIDPPSVLSYQHSGGFLGEGCVKFGARARQPSTTICSLYSIYLCLLAGSLTLICEPSNDYFSIYFLSHTLLIILPTFLLVP